jgi:hypothetical protein
LGVSEKTCDRAIDLGFRFVNILLNITGKELSSTAQNAGEIDNVLSRGD